MSGTALVRGEQRQGRIDRIGQTGDVDVHDLVTDTKLEERARKRLETKYALGDIFQSSTEGLDDAGLAHYIAQHRAKKPKRPDRVPNALLRSSSCRISVGRARDR